ncbi:MAG: hypothetical protein PSN34_09340 [Urechidicola sp.]|nr:hypothetical protein [Urechidicola sp.]
MLNFFGLLNKESFERLSKKETIDFLILKNALSWIQIIKGEKEGVSGVFIDLNKAKTELNPSEELQNEFYDFIINMYQHIILERQLVFYKQFNDSIFGKDEGEQKNTALVAFKNIYEELKASGLELYKRKKSSAYGDQFESGNRFEKLNGIKVAKKINLCPLPIAIEYIQGNGMYFESENFKSLEFFGEMIDFEIGLKILVSLNEKYHFEEDLYFSEYGELKKIFEKYNHIFKSFEIFIHTYKSINNFQFQIPSEIESLYDALCQRNLIVNKKSKFIDYLQKEHNIIQKKLRKFEIGQNLNHDSRVKIFLDDLEKYSAKK